MITILVKKLSVTQNCPIIHHFSQYDKHPILSFCFSLCLSFWLKCHAFEFIDSFIGLSLLLKLFIECSVLSLYSSEPGLVFGLVYSSLVFFWQGMRWHHRLIGHEFEQTLGDGEGQGSLACWSPWGHKESDMIEQLNDKISLLTLFCLFIAFLICLLI